MSENRPEMTPDTFRQLQEISRLTRFPDQEGRGRELLIRFLDSYGGSSIDLPIVDSLCARFGLFPYMSPIAVLDENAALAVEYHTPTELAMRGFTFHSEQQQIYQRLMDGESVILSAPTSFGKSVIVDALVASQKWDNIVVIVPTIALIDETRRRLSTLGNHYVIITHPAQTWSERNIFILTQERFLELEKVPPVGFFIIDEFYKLSSVEAVDTRRSLLNIAWMQLKKTGAQYYLTGPNINSLHIGLDEEIQNKLITTEFKTVVVDIEDRSHIPEGELQLLDLKNLLADEVESPSLIFVGSPPKASRLALELASGSNSVVVNNLADWIADHFHPEWYVVEALRGGIGVHTGPLPRSLQRAMVRLFQSGEIDTLICTSTLIEGVNTVAKNVVIFEKSIDRKPLDFFTFNNIRGRAGRMLKHFVGRVITYSAPPDGSQTQVDIPIETQSPLASLSTLVQIDEDELSEESRDRLSHVLNQDSISLETIKKNKGIDPELLIDAAAMVDNLNASQRAAMVWSGAPTSAEARMVLELGFNALLQPRQRQGMNFNMLWGKLQAARDSAGDVRRMVDRQLSFKRGNQSTSDVVDDVLKFQRNWMGFTIPSMLRGLQSVQSEVFARYGLPRGNYEYFLRDVESLYMPPNIVELEEYGLPLPLAQKLVGYGLRGDTLQETLEILIDISRSKKVLESLSAIERWFLDDVVSGLKLEINTD